jgi:hypothetical protein
MNIEVTVEEASAIINALAMQHPLIKRIADQVTAQQQQAQPNGLDKSAPLEGVTRAS